MGEPAKVIEFKLPKRRPKIIEKQAPPDQRHHVVMPIKALTDKRLTDNQVRVLGVLCSYCNRAGITWVGQARVGKDLGVSQQAVAKQLKVLRERGYIEVTSRGFRGERANTIRVIHDESISQEDAIAATSSIEDTRPPHQVKAEMREMEFTEEQMAANRKRLKEMLTGLTQKNHTTHQPVQIGAILMPRRPKKQPSHTQPNTVVNEEGLHTQPHTQPNRVVGTQKNIGLHEVLSLYEDIIKRRFTLGFVRTTEQDLKAAEVLCEVGVTASELDAALTDPASLVDITAKILDAKVAR